MIPATLKRTLGHLFIDAPMWLAELNRQPNPGIGIHNRDERISVAPDRSGARIDAKWTSLLGATNTLPWLGERLLQKNLDTHPFHLAATPATQQEAPQVSVVIGHRGEARLTNLLSVIASVAAQRGVSLECIVVEQDDAPRCLPSLPPWVRHIHTPVPEGFPLYSRSWALNVGAKAARGEVLLLQDNDILLPQDYADAHWRACQHHDCASLKRFLFYINEAQSLALREPGFDWSSLKPESILHNALGGGSLAIRREIFMAIGGMDEGFLGWGGEDNELWERVQTGRVNAMASLPIMHLWHPQQSGKREAGGAGSHTADYGRQRSTLSIETRIRELNERDWGNPEYTHAIHGIRNV